MNINEKFKSLDLEEIKNNKNVIGTFKKTIDRKVKTKKTLSAIKIFNIVYDKYISQNIREKNEENILEVLYNLVSNEIEKNDKENSNYNIGEIIEVNNEKYLIEDTINYYNNTYLYLINNSINKDDTAVVKISKENGIDTLKSIDNKEEFDYIINRVFLDLKSELELILND